MPISTTAMIMVLLALALAAGLSWLAARRIGRPESPSTAPWWGALAVGLAYTLGHAGVAMPSIPPGDVTDRIPLIAIAGALVAAIAMRGRDRLRERATGLIILSALTFVVMLGPILSSGDLSNEAKIQFAATGIVAVLAALNLAGLDVADRRSEIWVALTVFGIGASLVLVLANSAVLFQLGGILALVLLASLVGSRGRPIGGGIPVVSALLTALIVEGYYYAFLPTSAAMLLAASPCSLWLTRFGPLSRLGPRGAASVSAVLMLLCAAAAVALVLASKSSEGDASSP